MLVVHQSLAHASLRDSGAPFGIGALVSITLGAIFQKRIHQAPMDVLPMQYAIALLMSLVCVPFQPFSFNPARS